MRAFSAIAPAGMLTLNQRMHWAQQARLVRYWRTWAYYQGLAAFGPHQPPSVVTVELPVPDRRRRDPHNWHPTLKAIVDGLVDANCWPDDTPEFVAVGAPVLVVRRDRVVTVRLTPLSVAQDGRNGVVGPDTPERVQRSSQTIGENDSQEVGG